MIRSLIVLSVCIIVSCNHKQAGQSNFEVVKMDYHNHWMQRIFVVVDSRKVYDTSFIDQVICTLQQRYPLTEKSAVSFFSDKKYADYKTELFMNESGMSLSATEYKNWSYSYLGEYEFETNEYKTFPLSDSMNKQHVYLLKCNR